MIDQANAMLACRNRALAVVSATTTSIAMSATATGYVRASGSFITDGFEAGMECLGAGFSDAANNAVGLITAVNALELTILGGRTVESSGSGKTVSVGFPALRAFEGMRFSPSVGRPYAAEEFSVLQHELHAGPAAGGMNLERGLYVLRLYLPAGYASIGLRKQVNAVLALFTPGTALAAGSDTVRVNETIAPWASRIEFNGKDHMLSTITIPWYAFSTNQIAA